MKTGANAAHSPIGQVPHAIFTLRGQRVLLDTDVAALYDVTIKRLNGQVGRNSLRFPPDFMFRLTNEEVASLRAQPVASKPGRRYAFTAHGLIMAAMVLNSSRAVSISVYLIRASVQQRELLAFNKDLAKKLDDIDASAMHKLASYDIGIARLLKMICELLSSGLPPGRN